MSARIASTFSRHRAAAPTITLPTPTRPTAERRRIVARVFAALADVLTAHGSRERRADLA